MPTRKRSREDDSSDPMPLSKRINNLHLTNPGQGQSNGVYAQSHPHPHSGTSVSATVALMNGQDVVMSGDRTHHDPHSQLISNGHSSNHHHHHPNHPPGGLGHHHQNLPSTSHHQQVHSDAAGYDPELGQSDNPHYYHKNKLLYELHFMRSRRCHPDNE